MMTLLLPKVKSLLRKEIMCVNDPVDSEFEKAQLLIRTALQEGERECSPVGTQPSFLTLKWFHIFFPGERLSTWFENCLLSLGEKGPYNT